MTIISGLKNDQNKDVTFNTEKPSILEKGDFEQLQAYLGMSSVELYKIFEGIKIPSGESVSLDKLIKSFDEANVTNPDEALAKAKNLKELIGKMETKLKKLEEVLAKKPNDAPAKSGKSELENAIAEAKNELTGLLENISKAPKLTDDQKQLLKDAGGKDLSAKQDAAKGNTTGNTPPPPSYGKGMAPGYGSGAPAGGMSPGVGKGMGLPVDGSAYPFNPMSMINAGIMDDFTMGAWDMVGEQQKKQQMMMLFFYYARMAMSGDLNAMYQFMRFIGYVICRDKALQNTWLGTKLIELQETSRKATEKLLGTDVGEDLESQTQWQKELQKIKSEEGIVATSQKLITQMMEEFTQISEMLTNMQKSLLDVNGKVMSNLSVWR